MGDCMDGYEKRTRKKRDAILAAARELFFRDGISAGVVDIAKRAGVSPVTIYNYFGSKEHLLREVMEQFVDEAMVEFEAVMHEPISFEEKMTKLFAMKRSYEHLHTGGITSNMAWGDPTVQQWYKELYTKKYVPVMRALIEQGKAEGAIHESITWEAFLAFTNAVMSILTQPDFLKSDISYKWAINRLFYYGLLGK